ncbi:hypothetical protein EDD18DRAFT_1360925 [Armillaria luteobubalina]|uniref:Uncharacterized protein n=1 Tax=Armillaria luteobubalina TaxID=153913 RepID=A0AA39PJJ6_9AGAR|nr:hypothetical protein EDD18DRAFT_1360925 [Armillaria luteobubalina]
MSSFYSVPYDLTDDIPALTARSVVSSLAEPAAFFGRALHLRRLAVNVVMDGGGDGDRRVGRHEVGLFKELETFKVGTVHLRVRRMRFFFGRNGIISLEDLRELVFPVTSEVDGWMPCSHELFNRAPWVETVTLLDWRGAHQNVDLSVISVPSPLRPPSIYGPIRDSEGSGRQEYQGGCGGYGYMHIGLDKEDTGYRSSLRKAVIIVDASPVMDDEGVGAVWMRLLMMNVAVCMDGECTQTIWGVSRECEGGARGEEGNLL